eukprot:s2639_g14.t2
MAASPLQLEISFRPWCFRAGQAFQSLAAAHLHNKDFATAERAARAARDVCRKDGRWQGDAAGVMSMAEVLLAEQKVDDAVDLAKEAQSLYSEHHDRRGEAKALVFVAKARMSSEEYEKACFAAERAHELFARLRDEEGKCEALVLAAQCRIQLLQRQQKQSSAKLKGKKASLKAPLPWEDLSKASKASTQAREAAKKLGDPKAEAAALCALAQIYIFNGRPQSEIFNTLDEALFVAAEAEDPKSEGTALLLQAQMHLEASELQSALKAARQAQLIVDKSGDAAQKSQVESILDQLRGHEFRVDEAPRIDPRMVVGQMALPMVSGPDPAAVRATIQEVTKKMVGSGNDIEADMPLMDIGINSMNAVLFRNKLITEFKDVELPTTLVFDYPTVKTLSGLVVEQVTQAATAAQQQAMAAAMPMMSMPGTGYPVMPQPGVTPIEVASKIQEVTKGMVGSDRDIDADMPLMDIGINSMNAVLFRNKLGSAFEGVELPNTLVFDYPTVKDLSELLMQLTSKEASCPSGELCLALRTVVQEKVNEARAQPCCRKSLARLRRGTGPYSTRPPGNLMCMDNTEHDLSLFVSCRADLTGRYSPIGYTAAGTPYYGSDSGFYLFHDPSCDGTEDQAARWVLDVDAPSTEAFQDLDQDGKCAYQARLNGGNTSAPPSTALWTVFCGGSWQEEEVLVTEDRGNHYQQECFQAGACRDGGSTPCEWCGLHQGQRLFCCSASDENPEHANCFGTPGLDSGASFRCVTTTTTTPAADRYLSGCGSHCEDGSPCAWCGLHDQKEMFCCSEKEYSFDQACRKADWSSRRDASGQPVCVPQTPPHKAFAQESTSSGVLMASVLTAAILLVLLVVGISFILRMDRVSMPCSRLKAPVLEMTCASHSTSDGPDFPSGRP